MLSMLKRFLDYYGSMNLTLTLEYFTFNFVFKVSLMAEKKTEMKKL